MTTQLLVFGVLGVLTTAYAFWTNRRLFGVDGAGRITLLEGAYYFFGVVSVCIGWYFNVRYTHHVGSKASYIAYTKALFANWASDSAAQDYIMVNVVLLPLWTIVDGRRRGIRSPWIFFVMSLFTSLAFAMAFYLAFVERQIRFSRKATPETTSEPISTQSDRTVAPT
jgi:Terpene cyclase DEP1